MDPWKSPPWTHGSRAPRRCAFGFYLCFALRSQASLRASQVNVLRQGLLDKDGVYMEPRPCPKALGVSH
jgi:hypothetical protein